MLAIPLIAFSLFVGAPADLAPVTSTTVSVTAVPAAFNPAATSRAATTTISVRPEVAGTLEVDIIDASGVVVAALTGARAVSADTPVTTTWAGEGTADGAYGVRARLTDVAGGVQEAVTPVRVDATAPVVRLATPAPVMTARGPVRINVGALDPSSVERLTLRVHSQTGAEVGTVKIPVAEDRRGGEVSWNLRLRGRLLLPGVYRLTVTGLDGVGNVGTSSARTIRVDRAVTNTQISSLRDAGNVVALAFDDCLDAGPWSRLLKALKATGTRATFFCNGANVRANPVQARQTVAAGHTIGSHTWAHRWMTKTAAAERSSQIQGDKDIWWTVARASPAPFFRPPYGDVNAAVRASAGSEGFAYTVMWDVDPSDYLNPPPATLAADVGGTSRAGSIVVLHVTDNTAAAVPAMVRTLRARGLEPVSLDEMFGTASYLSRGRD